MSGFHTYKLKEVCTKIGSGATPRGGKETYSDHGEIFLIRSQNVLDFFFSLEGGAYISEKQAKLLDGVKVHKNDVLINITGDSVARVCSVPDYINESRVNQHVSILRTNPSLLSNVYLKYYLLQPQVKSLLLTMSSAGATRKALTKGDLEEFEVDLPSISVQKRIADILAALDDKIELNRQMNQTLEQMAQALYKHYFLDEIDPENLPEGWRNGKLGEIYQ
ncbi:MAG: restriction endonuclease subunit S, partial [Candidatus Staskawiczbacteria bacterium]